MYFYFSILIIVFNTALSDTNLSNTRIKYLVNESFNDFIFFIDKLENLIIPCTDDELCENDFPGSKCVKNICSCMSENGCLEKEVPFMVRKLGRPCKSNEDCLIDNSECILTENGGICACIKDTVASEDQKQCLPCKFNFKKLSNISNQSIYLHSTVRIIFRLLRRRTMFENFSQ